MEKKKETILMKKDWKREGKEGGKGGRAGRKEISDLGNELEEGPRDSRKRKEGTGKA